MPFGRPKPIMPEEVDGGADFTAVRSTKSTKKRSRARRDASRDSTPTRGPRLSTGSTSKKQESFIGKGSRYASPAGSRPDANFGPREMNRMIDSLNTQAYVANATQYQSKSKNLLQDFLNVQPDKMQTLTGSKKERTSAARARADSRASRSPSQRSMRKKRAHFEKSPVA